jgi:hypothetical protein
VYIVGDYKARNKIILLDVAVVVAPILDILYTLSHYNLGKYPHYMGFTPYRSNSISIITKVLVY